MTGRKKKSMSHDPLLDLQNDTDVNHDAELSEHLRENPVNQINLGDNLTIQEVEQYLNSTRSTFDNGMKIVIDTSELQRIDGAGVQLLCAIYKEAANKNITLEWINTNDKLMTAVKSMGLAEIVKLEYSGQGIG